MYLRGHIMRFLLAFAVIATLAYMFQHFYRSFVYSQRTDELKLVAEQAIASWKECQHHYGVELKYSELQTNITMRRTGSSLPIRTHHSLASSCSLMARNRLDPSE